MSRRINLLSLLVIAAGGAVAARPTPAGATMPLNPWTRPVSTPESCCTAYTAYGHETTRCCSNGGCLITFGKCTPWS